MDRQKQKDVNIIKKRHEREDERERETERQGQIDREKQNRQTDGYI